MGGKGKSSGGGTSRKSRLDKGGAGVTEFIGFSAFASAPANAATGGPPGGAAGRSELGWSPVYTGGDPQVHRLFSRLVGKRDSLTRRKALDELSEYLRDVGQPKRVQIEALSHFAYLYRHQLYVQHAASLSSVDWSRGSRCDSGATKAPSSSSSAAGSPAVRAACLRVWSAAARSLPRAAIRVLRAHPEVAGMLFCLVADPAAEVRQAATELDDLRRGTAADEWPLPAGLWMYARFLLSFSTPAFYENWMASSSRAPRASELSEPQQEAVEETHSTLVSTLLRALCLYLSDRSETSASSPIDITTSPPPADPIQTFTEDDWTLWCKTMHSSSAALRRCAYQLVSVAAVHHGPRLHSFSTSTEWVQRMAAALAAEKQPSNVPALLEAVLATTNCCAQSSPDDSSADFRPLLDELLGRPLVRLVRKSGLGAAADGWTPAILPLVAAAPHPVPLVRALMTGWQSAPGSRDRRALILAQIECATYLLLRKTDDLLPRPLVSAAPKSEDVAAGDDSDEVLAHLWLQALDAARREEPPEPPRVVVAPDVVAMRSASSASGTPADVRSLRSVVTTLAHSWFQLEVATRTQRPCAFRTVQGWFWKEAEKLVVPDSVASFVIMLLQSVQEVVAASSQSQHESSAAMSCPHLLPPIRAYFFHHLSQYQSSSSSVPTGDAYALYMQVFRFVRKPSVIFDNRRALEGFVMNDLLRWMILHTSRRSTVSQSLEMVRCDFELLSTVVGSGAPENNDMDNETASGVIKFWPNMLKEVIAADVGLQRLRAGLQALLRFDPRAMEWVPCNSLDVYVTSLGGAAVSSVVEHTPGDNDLSWSLDRESCDPAAKERLLFYRLCLGLSDDASKPLVSPSVVTELVEQTCSPTATMFQATTFSRADPVLLTVLLEIAAKRSDILTVDDVHRVLLTSWLQEGKLFYDETIQLLKIPSLSSSFQSQASELLLLRLAALCQCDDEVAARSIGDGSLEVLVENWSEAAWRLVLVARTNGNDGQYFDLIGLAEPSRWKLHPDLMYACTMNVLTKLDGSHERLALLQSTKSDTVDLLTTMLSSVSDASADLAKAARVKFGRDRSARLLNLLGGSELNVDLLEQLITSTSARLAATLSDPSLVDVSRKGVAVISLLVRTRFRPVKGAHGSLPKASAICEGDSLWYISNPQTPELRTRVHVTKVHFDVQTGYYFTIRFNSDDENQERQTVLERLRLSPQDVADDCICANAIPDEERLKRGEVRDLIMRDIIVRYCSEHNWSVLVVELIGLLCENIGLGPEKGIGTMRYTLIQRVRTTERLFLDSLESHQTDASVDALFTLSLALGYGWCVNLQPSSVFSELVFDPTQVDQAILAQQKIIEGVPSMHQAVMAWLTLTVPFSVPLMHEKPESAAESFEKASLLIRLSKSHFEEKRHSGFRGSDLAAARALHVGFTFLSDSTVKPDVELLELAGFAARALVIDFAANWENDPGQVKRSFNTEIDWRADSPLFDILAVWRLDFFDSQFFAQWLDAERCEILSKNLFIPSKRLVAAYLLDRRLKVGDAVFANIDLDSKTLSRVNVWVQDLDNEEADEVRDDVSIVSQWLPRRMMQEVEEWGEEIYEDMDDATTIGRLLSWICVLGAVDAAVSPKQFRIRPAFVSYLSNSGAANAALNIAVLHDEAINEARGKAPPSLREVEDLLSSEACFTVPKIASLVLFLTVEVVPSLSRRWWEESCPKAYASDVQAFVEKWVAPEILKSKLARIRSDKDKFGDMVVRSSLASREVAASYVQDDFTLSVRITIPPSFPFKKAEVDCSMTLGVAAHRSRRWGMQIARMLNSEGGTLQDALVLWKDNVDQEFEGLEPCPICYSVLHVKTRKLPVLQCGTCPNRFHWDCLIHWFRSSGKSQCVMCQQPWNGTRVG